MKQSVAVVLLFGGLACVGLVYSMRPPAGMLDAVSMLASGRSTFIRSPLYEVLLLGSAGVAVVGAGALVRGAGR